MGRREIREHIFKVLFQVEFHNHEDFTDQIALFFEELDNPLKQKEQDEIKDKCLKIVDKLPKIDEMLNEKSASWNTRRMGKAELAIFRLAVYEILFDEQVPAGVAINEAVELAKKYGQEESFGFINGILANFVEKE